MAKTNDTPALIDWFKAWPIDDKDQIIAEFEAIAAQEKAARIRDLQGEIARLKSPRRKKPSTTVDISPKYRDPKDPTRTWAGRGGQPKWVRDHLAKGGQLDQLLIERPNGRG